MSTAKILVDNGINSIEKLIAVSKEDMVNMKGIGPKKAEVIFNDIQTKRNIIIKLGNLITFKEKSGHLVGKSFCFTGAMTRPRKELENMALNAGAETRKSVAAGLTYLVIADPNSTTVKAKKARELGTKCISEAEFKELCEK